ncbi:hypothetical protein NEMBOFW57_001673 [Staphylotrichum longicolle]|uniref:Major facilitator superfamily (MFS) profile domain-containing protein n=1 Tax=Staphylotrichum longicolle TaxID=669026 RepID=A0AAD4F2I8_9PEZI|nr:hypothetical protein NEMBOFW57_001673 [Staphylotrichum longicolle]
MLRGSTVSSETGLQDDKKKTVSVITVPLASDSDKCDPKSKGGFEVKLTKTQTATTGDAPHHNEAGPARISDATLLHGEIDEQFPEGGIRAWLVVFGCWLALFASLGLMNSLATFKTYVATNQSIHLGPSIVGGAIFGYASLSFLLGVYAGPLFDKYGPRWLLLASTAFMVASLLLSSTSSEFGHILTALGVLSSLASPLLFTPSIAAIGHFFKRRRGLATGIATTASSASGVVFPFILQALFVRVGWAWALRALALICLSLTVAANFLIRSRLPAAQNASPHPHARIFRTRGFTPTAVAVFLAQFASFLPLSYMSSYALSRGFSEAFSFQVVAILNASSAIGRIAAGGRRQDRPFQCQRGVLRPRRPGVFWRLAPGRRHRAGHHRLRVLFGCASGGSVSLAPVSVGRLCKTQEYGRYYGACYTIASLVVLFAIPVAGQLVRVDGGSYWGLIVTTGVFYVAAVVAFAAAKVSVVGRRVWAAF